MRFRPEVILDTRFEKSLILGLLYSSLVELAEIFGISPRLNQLFCKPIIPRMSSPMTQSLHKMVGR